MLLFLILLMVLIIAPFLWRARYRSPKETEPQVVCYHKVTNRFCWEGTWVTPYSLARQIDHLLSRGFVFIDEDEFLRLIRLSAGPNQKKILLTFDDGYSDVYHLALPILKERGIPALVFLVAGFMGKENRWDLSLGRRSFFHLSWNEADKLRSQGMSLGSHGMTHSDLTRLSSEECFEEMVLSKRIIEEKLGGEIKTFSYPFGRYNSAVKSMAGKAGYRAAFSLYPPRPNDVLDCYALRRSGVYIIDTAGSLVRKLIPGPLFWFEDMKGRFINGVSVLTPVFKSLRSHRDR